MEDKDKEEKEKINRAQEIVLETMLEIAQDSLNEDKPKRE